MDSLLQSSNRESNVNQMFTADNELETSIIDITKITNTNVSSAIEVEQTRLTATNSQAERNKEDGEEENDEIVLKYGAQHVIKLFVPVTACMLFVVISLNVITSYQTSNGISLAYIPFKENTQSKETKLWESLANASIFIGVVIVTTIFLILLYKYRCYKLIHGWLMISSLLLLFIFSYIYISELVRQLNIVIDFITLVFLMWNFGCIGMMCIHWIGPLRLQQIYLIIVSSLMALTFVKLLPEWTTWVLLAFISAWDLIAVLTPCGPLRMLVETAKSRNDKLFPALIYSSTVVYPLAMMVNNGEQPETGANSLISMNKKTAPATTGDDDEDDNESTIFDSPKVSRANINANTSGVDEDDDDGGFASNGSKRNKNIRKRNQEQVDDINQINVRVIQPVRQQQQQQQGIMSNEGDDEDNGVKLGLGDFIFYSVLVGKASILGDWNTVIACFVAILIGLCFTLVLLAIFHKALPALPISLTFGLIFYFCTNLVVRPFYDDLTSRQYFI